jgi:hypothetical protein
MHISAEGTFGIALGLVGIFGAGAMMIWPQHTEIGWGLIVFAAIGAGLLAGYHWRVALGIASGSEPAKRILAAKSAEMESALMQVASIPKPEKSPLRIIFDHANPNNRFWSLESPRDESGKQLPGSFLEYRALVRNDSLKTVRNVKVTVESIGALPRRAELSRFDLNKEARIDLTPGEEVLVIIWRWFSATRVVGTVLGEGVYGPLKVIASADDVLPFEKLFQVDIQKTPMVWELAP